MKIGKLAVASMIGLAVAHGLSDSAGAAEDSLKIGLIAPMTGPGAPWGYAGKGAGEIIAAEVNANGGLEVGGRKYEVEIIVQDDQYKAAEAVAAYNRLTNRSGVKYIILETSAPTLALKQNVEDDKVIALTSSYTPAAIDENTTYMFRLYSTATDFIPGYAEWLKDHVPQRRMITINPNDETGWSQTKVTKASYSQNGFDVLDTELYERTTKDFAPLLTKVLALKPDVIDLGSSSPATAGLIVRQARELDYPGRFVQTGGAGWADVVATAGKEAAEGMVTMLYADPASPGYRHLADEYAKRYGQRPNEIIAPYYDALKVLLAAIQKAGDVNDTAKVAAAIPTVLPMAGLQGDEMTYAHQQIRTYDYIGVLKDGAPVVTGKVK